MPSNPSSQKTGQASKFVNLTTRRRTSRRSPSAKCASSRFPNGDPTPLTDARSVNLTEDVPLVAGTTSWYVDPRGMAGEAIAWCGFQGYPGYSPDNARNSREDRDSQAAYLDAEFGLTDVWTLEAAVRWEDYSDAGSEPTGKLATRFQLWASLPAPRALSPTFQRTCNAPPSAS